MLEFTKIDKEFYDKIVVPMVGKCADKNFGNKFADQKERLCENVAELNKLFTDLNANHYSKKSSIW
jgi:hypothetical protein